jgi:hypothetical protein
LNDAPIDSLTLVAEFDGPDIAIERFADHDVSWCLNFHDATSCCGAAGRRLISGVA